LKNLDFAGLWGESWMIYAIERHEDLLEVNVICLWREGEVLGWQAMVFCEEAKAGSLRWSDCRV